MAKQKANKPAADRPAPASINAWDKAVKPEKITVDSVVISDKHSKTESRLLSTPAPWQQDWLDRNGLRVVYKNGGAMLVFMK